VTDAGGDGPTDAIEWFTAAAAWEHRETCIAAGWRSMT